MHLGQRRMTSDDRLAVLARVGDGVGGAPTGFDDVTDLQVGAREECGGEPDRRVQSEPLESTTGVVEEDHCAIRLVCQQLDVPGEEFGLHESPTMTEIAIESA